MVDIHSATTEIRQGKKRKKKNNNTRTTVLRPSVRDYLGEPVPEETLTHPTS